MKTKLTLLAIILINLFACKKDRVIVDDFQSMDSFYNLYKEPEQEYVIDTPGTCPLIAAKGTKFCIGAGALNFSGGGNVTYPFTLKVVELYSIKDMILWRLPSISGSSILETSAEIRARTFKNSTEVYLRSGSIYMMEMDTMSNIFNNPQPYYGRDNGTITDWSVDNLSAASANAYSYDLNVGRTGWISAARVHSAAGQITNITFTSTGTNTQNIELYISFGGFKGLMKVSNLVSGSVPVGENVTLFAMAKNQNNEYLLLNVNTVVTAGMQVPLTMQVVTEADLLATLNSL